MTQQLTCIPTWELWRQSTRITRSYCMQLCRNYHFRQGRFFAYKPVLVDDRSRHCIHQLIAPAFSVFFFGRHFSFFWGDVKLRGRGLISVAQVTHKTAFLGWVHCWNVFFSERGDGMGVLGEGDVNNFTSNTPQRGVNLFLSFSWVNTVLRMFG